MSAMQKTENSSRGRARILPTGSFAETLVAEDARFKEVGVQAAMISLDFQTDGSDSARDQLIRSRAIRFLQARLSSSDLISEVCTHRLSILMAPVESLAALNAFTRDLSLQLEVAGLPAAAGFAHRRQNESLFDTWARADAQVDRIIFRNHRTPNGLVLR